MSNEVLVKVKNTIQTHMLIENGESVVLGLSGGPDSTALLHILNDLKDGWSFKLYAFHVNHMIRGEESDGDEAYAKEECEKLGVPFESVRIDIPAIAGSNDDSLEECARKERQKALLSYAKKLGAKVALAHNQDDQAETVMLRILRGTGTHGLAGMEYKREDGIIRPLLDVKRFEIEKYCEENDIHPHIDSTNKSTEYLRNKVRIEILPQLEKINPSIKDALFRIATSAREDDAYIQAAAVRWYTYNANAFDEVVMIDTKQLQMLDRAMFQRVVKLAFARVGLVEDVASSHINTLRDVIESNVGNKTVEFPNGYVAYINHGICNFQKK